MDFGVGHEEGRWILGMCGRDCGGELVGTRWNCRRLCRGFQVSRFQASIFLEDVIVAGVTLRNFLICYVVLGAYSPHILASISRASCISNDLVEIE